MPIDNTNDELQLDDDQFDTDYDEDDLDVEEPEDEQASDSEPDSDTEHEAKDGEQPNPKVEERIGELTRKRREAEREAKELRERYEQLERQLLEGQEPQIPDLPDPDEVSEQEWHDALRRRDQAMQDKLQWQQRKNQLDQQTSTRTQQQQLAQQQELVTKAQTYAERAKKFGIKPEELQAAAAVVNQVGLSDDVALHILEHDMGAAITRHLANNVEDLLEIASANPIKAALYIEQKIKPRLNPQKRKSRTPQPPNRMKGGTPSKKDKFPLTGGRATFE